MSVAGLNTPPNYPYLGEKKAVMTERGWCHPDTGEVLHFVSNGAAKAGAADIVSVIFVNGDDLGRGDNLSVKVIFNEKVDVSAGSTIVISTESGSDITLYAAAQSNVQEVLYSKESDATTQETLPDRADTYTVAAQTLGGTIKDRLGAVAASATLTVTQNPVADETVTINSVAYTFKDSVTTTARQVKIGITKEITMDNLAAAINADSSAGSGAYGSLTTANADVTAVAVDATVVVTAITKGTAGNSLTVAETLSNGSWSGATLAGGTATATPSKTVSTAVAALAGEVSIPAGAVVEVAWADETLAQGEAVSVTVTFDEPVDVTAGAYIVISSDTGNFNLYAAAQSNVTEVVFDKQSNNSSAKTVPANVQATGTLTLTGNAANGNTVTVGGKTYTFQTSLTNVANNVLIGATASDSIDNLIAAINASAGSGTLYAALTTVNAQVSAAAGAGDTMVVTAKTAYAVGDDGNDIASTETLGSGSWGGATLAGGVTNAPTTLSIAAQTIQGTIVDNGANTISANLAISEEVVEELVEIDIA